MDGLDLLKSLTIGVNNKVSSFSEDIGEVSYKVNTSLKGRKKVNKSADKSCDKEVLNIDKEIIEDVMVENTDFIEEEIYQDEYSNEVFNDFSEDEYVEEVFGEISEDEIIEEVYDENIQRVESFNISDTIEENESVEKPINEEVYKPKIDRQGNVFKRGPRKKKPKVDEVQKIIEEIKEDSIKQFDDTVKVLKATDKNIENIVEETIISQVELEKEIEVSNVDEELSVKEVTEESIKDIIEDKSFLFSEDTDFSFNITDKSVDNNENCNLFDDGIKEKVEDKFKNCKYYVGMSIEEFLRENKEYREAMYVEHFYSKDFLKDLLNKGLILLSKGVYKL